MDTTLASRLGLMKSPSEAAAPGPTAAPKTPEGPGKRLSQRLYVVYETGTNAAMGTLTLLYDVSRRLTLRARAGEENAVDLLLTIPHDWSASARAGRAPTPLGRIRAVLTLNNLIFKIIDNRCFITCKIVTDIVGPATRGLTVVDSVVLLSTAFVVLATVSLDERGIEDFVDASSVEPSFVVAAGEPAITVDSVISTSI